MNVKEMIEWLKTQDQEAIVEVVVHSSGSGYYDQGGNACTEEFTIDTYDFNIPKHYEYTSYEGKTFLLLGELNG